MFLLQDVLVLAVAQNTSADNCRARALRQRQRHLPPPTARSASATPQPTAASVPVHPRNTHGHAGRRPRGRRAPRARRDYGNCAISSDPARTHPVAVMPADLGTLASPIQVAAGQIIATEISPTNTKVGDTSTSRSPSATPPTSRSRRWVRAGLHLRPGPDLFHPAVRLRPRQVARRHRHRRSDTTELPYRWGLGGDLAPGATTTVTGPIKVTQDFKTTNFWAALVNEPSTVVQTGVGMTLVTSLPENLAIVAVDAAIDSASEPDRQRAHQMPRQGQRNKGHRWE